MRFESQVALGVAAVMLGGSLLLVLMLRLSLHRVAAGLRAVYPGHLRDLHGPA